MTINDSEIEVKGPKGTLKAPIPRGVTFKQEEGKLVAEVGFGGEVFKLFRAGDFLFATSADKSLRQFRAQDQQEIRNYAGHNDWTLAAALRAYST